MGTHVRIKDFKIFKIKKNKKIKKNFKKKRILKNTGVLAFRVILPHNF